MAEFRLLIPASHEPERRHAATLVFDDVLGVDVNVVTSSVTVPTITDGELSLQVADGFFAHDRLDSIEARRNASRRRRVDEPMRTNAQDLPWLFDDDSGSQNLVIDERGARLTVDVFGAVFFLATMFEEVDAPAVDRHGRFLAINSTAVRGEFLRRPVAEEHVDLLWMAMRSVWPRLERRRRAFEAVLTFDVDNPYAYQNRRLRSVARSVVGRGVIRGRPRSALAMARGWADVRRHGVDRDPWNTFDVLMTGTESLGVQGMFHLIADPDPAGRNPDAVYRLDDPAVVSLIDSVRRRGHLLGVHGSYESHLSVDRLRREVETVRELAADFGQPSRPLHGRQHYLRWDAAASPATQAAAGLDVDSTVGFAERAGFRAGMCRPFHAYDHRSRRTLPLMVRPLIVMDRTLVDAGYENLARESAVDLLEELAATCRRHQGEYVVLWHNDSLHDDRLGPLWNDLLAVIGSGA
ncbi:polysaccharide deacetylase family protein [Actinospongicola halichondriae]|uniref:polysaccharide deacetylase family protein n=1 Tax=Actinospongicola halichondriae TaxID=3236844 RepID=UPI003D461D90